MSRSSPRSIYSIASVVPYARATGLPYGEIRVLKSSSISLNASLQDLMGGASKFPWATEEGAMTCEMTINSGEIPDFMFELFLGIAPTDTGAAANGSISALTNTSGSSIQNGTNGISSVSLITGSQANLKFANYAIKALTASTFNLYMLGTHDIGRGVDGSVLTDDLVVSSAVGFTASVASVPAFGLQFNQVGTPAFTVGDTAVFYVLPVNSKSMLVTVGGLVNQSFPEFGCLVYPQKRGNGELMKIDLFRAKAAGMPIPLEYGNFAHFETKVKGLYDDVKDGVFRVDHVST